MLVGILTAFTLVAFAANSLLCRMALGGSLIDPVSFTTLRLVSGAIILVPLTWIVGLGPGAVRLCHRVLPGLPISGRGNGCSHPLWVRAGHDDRCGAAVR